MINQGSLWQHTGKVIIKWVSTDGEDVQVKKLLDIEQYLNDKIVIEINKIFSVMLRAHL